jgi:hypothetical protein
MLKRIVVASLLLVPSLAAADRRLFTYTYEYKTVPQGHTAIELWHTQARATWDSDTAQELEHVLEVEHGLTDRWDAALYWVFGESFTPSDPSMDDPFGLHEMKLETRYRFADRGELPVDILAYGEAVKVWGESLYEIEAKAILARDFDAVTASVNLIGAVELGTETEAEGGWAAGLSYEVHPKFSVGAETYGKVSEYEFSTAPVPRSRSRRRAVSG